MEAAGRREWHSDQSYMLQPATGAALYTVELPTEGGETFWVDLRAAYAGLPPQLRARIAGKRGIFDYTKRLAGYGREPDQHISEAAKRLTSPVTHALVRAHPETADRSLHLDSTTTVGIHYMDKASGLALLDEVYEHATPDDFVYAHHGRSATWPCGTTASRCTGAHRSTRARGAVLQVQLQFHDDPTRLCSISPATRVSNLATLPAYPGPPSADS
jgi:hypothetical protein